MEERKMTKEEKAKRLGRLIRELAEMVEECLDDNDFDRAGFHLVDLQEYAYKLDNIIMELI
jgi:hypothetical protein